MKRIYTKTGDRGQTTLLLGGQVSKTDPRCQACGAVDEAVSALGLGRALSCVPRVKELAEELQRDLLALASELASNPSRRQEFEQRFPTVDASVTRWVEEAIEGLSSEMGPMEGFITPGGSPASAALDLARSVIRRAERRVVSLQEAGLLPNAEIIRYLNRASDLAFMLARYEERHGNLKTEPSKDR